MIWTTDKPTRPGWYWWRNPELHYRAQVCRVSHARAPHDGEALGVAYTDGERYTLADMVGGEWAGPILEPDEQA